MDVFILASNFVPLANLFLAFIWGFAAIFGGIIFVAVLGRIEEAKKRNQNWFRIHLSTAVVMSLLAGGLMTLNYINRGFPFQFNGDVFSLSLDFISWTFFLMIWLFGLESAARRNEKPRSEHAVREHDK